MMKRLRQYIRQFFHERSNVRWKAAQALGKIGDPRATSHLTAVLDEDDPTVMAAAIGALGAIGDSAAIPHLAAKLKHPNATIRAKAVTALGCFENEAVCAALLGLLEDKDPTVRAATCFALAENGGDSRIEGALSKMLKDRKRQVQEAAAESLVRIGGLAEKSCLRVRTLGEWPENCATPQKAANSSTCQIQANPDKPVTTKRVDEARIEVANPLINEPFIILLNVLQNSRWNLRAQACDALGQFANLEVARALTYSLQDADWRVQKAAAESLAKIGQPAISSLTEAIKDKWFYARWRPVEVLGEIGDQSQTSFLISLLRDKNEFIRERAAEALSKIEGTSPKHLIQALEDHSENVRRAAIEGLRRMGRPAGQYLRPLLKSRTRTIKHAAAALLGSLGDAAALDPLLSCLADADLTFREIVVEALGETRDSRAVPALLLELEKG